MNRILTLLLCVVAYYFSRAYSDHGANREDRKPKALRHGRSYDDSGSVFKAEATLQSDSFSNSPPINTATLKADRVLQATISMCKVFDDNSNCIYCFRDQYMNNSVCVDVPDAQLINHCNIYEASITCNECDAGYVLSNDKKSCALGPASLNCDVYIDSSTCKTCKAGSVLNNGKCVVFQNCAQANNNGCLMCVPTYYLDNSGATPVCVKISAADTIPNCLTYSADRLCSSCDPSFTLALDRKTCLSRDKVLNQVDPNCQSTFINDGQFCSACVEGYYLKNGVCEKCQQSESCLVCDPKAPNVCLLCRPKYFMSSAASTTCALNVELASQTENRDPLQPASIGLATLNIGLALLLLQIFWLW